MLRTNSRIGIRQMLGINGVWSVDGTGNLVLRWHETDPLLPTCANRDDSLLSGGRSNAVTERSAVAEGANSLASGINSIAA